MTKVYEVEVEGVKKNIVRVGSVVWVKGTITKVREDGYVIFDDNRSPISGCIFQDLNGGEGVYDQVEIKIEN